DATAGREAMDALQARDGFAVGGEIALRAKEAASAEIEPDVAEAEMPAHAPAPLLETVRGDETARSTIANVPLDLHDKQAPPAAPAEAPAKAEFADALATQTLEKAAAAVPTEVGQLALTTDDAVARKIGTGVPAEAAEPSDADTVRVELVYADAATRAAAAVPIEAMVGQWQSMDAMVAGGRGFGSAEMRRKASTPVGEANVGSSLAEPGETVIVLEGSPEVIREAVRYVEQVGTAAGSVRMKVDGASLRGDRSNVPTPVRVGKGGLPQDPSPLSIDASQSHTQVALGLPSSKALAEQPARPATQSVVVPEQQQLAGREVAARTASAPVAVAARSGTPPGQAVDHEAVAQHGQAASSPAFTFADQAKEPRRMRLQIRLIAPSAVTASTQPATTQPAPAATRPSVESRPTSGPTAGP
ncbi:MAG: hypothetical protein JXA69_10705, partial [Phycisphaerae bacterium]|nr:hypothetical protein [Phycisphaerae bacterium]